MGEEVEQRGVPPPHELIAADGADPVGVRQLGVVGGDGGLGQHVVEAVLLHHGVGDVGSHRQRQVRRQRPRRGGPGQHPHRPGVAGFGHQVESHGDGRVLAGPGGVVEAYLEVRQGRLRPPRVRHHPVGLVHQPLAVELGEGPHDRLHVGQVHGLVVVAEVHPAGLAGHRVLPLPGVADDRLAAVLVELGDAELGDGRPAGYAQLALGLHLGGQPVAVPAEAAVHPVAPHGLVPGHDILHVAGEQVAVVRETVGEGRSVIENPVALGRPGPHRLLESSLGLPAGQHPLLDGRKIGAADGWVGAVAAFGHGRSGYRRARFVLAIEWFRPANPEAGAAWRRKGRLSLPRATPVLAVAWCESGASTLPGAWTLAPFVACST